jgi:hypothetical protein
MMAVTSGFCSELDTRLPEIDHYGSRQVVASIVRWRCVAVSGYGVDSSQSVVGQFGQANGLCLREQAMLLQEVTVGLADLDEVPVGIV